MSEQLLDETRLKHWLSEAGLCSSKDAEAAVINKLAGGRSNEMFTIDCGEQHWVLRRPAGVAWEKTEAGLMREYRLLDALANQNLPIPEAVARCEERDVLGAAFYLMQKVEGFVPAMEFPPEFTVSQQTRNDTVFAGLNAAAALHNVDWRAAGLEDFGKPDQFHERQVQRWLSQFDSYNGRELPQLRKLGEWLEGNLPAQWTPTIMHGDYHPLNILLANDQPARVSAIVDWETATIGDPFLDIIGYLDIWFDANGHFEWPSYDELIAHYLSQVSFAPENIDYYRVLYYFRMAVLLEGIYQRSLIDETRETNYGMAERVEVMIERAEAVL